MSKKNFCIALPQIASTIEDDQREATIGKPGAATLGNGCRDSAPGPNDRDGAFQWNGDGYGGGALINQRHQVQFGQLSASADRAHHVS
jgi:hypothetical protein